MMSGCLNRAQVLMETTAPLGKPDTLARLDVFDRGPNDGRNGAHLQASAVRDLW